MAKICYSLKSNSSNYSVLNKVNYKFKKWILLFYFRDRNCLSLRKGDGASENSIDREESAAKTWADKKERPSTSLLLRDKSNSDLGNNGEYFLNISQISY